VVVLAAVDEVFVCVKRLVEVVWFGARSCMTGPSFLLDDGVDRR